MLPMISHSFHYTNTCQFHEVRVMESYGCLLDLISSDIKDILSFDVEGYRMGIRKNIIPYTRIT